MAIEAAAIRRSIVQVMEGSTGLIRPLPGVFRYGVFEGRQDSAKQARLVQTDTAAHWFDVRVGRVYPSPSAAPTHSSSRLEQLAITVQVWSHLTTEVQESDRNSVLAAIGSDCEDACQALQRGNQLLEDDSGNETGIVGGCLAGVSWQLMREDWQAKYLVSQLTGTCHVRAATVLPPDAILGSDLVAWFDARDLHALDDGAAVSSWTNRTGNGNAVQATGSLQPLYSATGLNGQPAVVGDGTNDVLLATFSDTIDAGSRPYMWIVMARAENEPSTSYARLGNIGGQSVVLGTNASSHWFAFANGATTSGASLNASLDTDPHVAETGFTTGGTSLLVVDDDDEDGNADPGVTQSAISTLRICGDGGDYSTALISQVVVSSALPTAAQRAAMQAWGGGVVA